MLFMVACELVYTDLGLAVLNECNLFFLHILLRLSLENAKSKWKQQ